MSDSLDEKKELARLRDDLARSRTEMSHSLALQRHDVREEKALQRHQLVLQGDMDAMKLSHQLDPEVRDRDFADMVREENLRVQSLGAELAVRWQYEKADRQLEQKNLMEQVQGEIVKNTLQNKLDMKKMEKEEALEEKLIRFKAELAQEFGQLSDEQIQAMVAKLVEQGKV